MKWIDNAPEYKITVWGRLRNELYFCEKRIELINVVDKKNVLRTS